ncbi:MAG TPA: hypothetical protein ENK56_09000 [Chloroflexi bacterium]|nr:hypothetical protein [Chloroflexota bacterium]
MYTRLIIQALVGLALIAWAFRTAPRAQRYTGWPADAIEEATRSAAAIGCFIVTITAIEVTLRYIL